MSGNEMSSNEMNRKDMNGNEVNGNEWHFAVIQMAVEVRERMTRPRLTLRFNAMSATYFLIRRRKVWATIAE